MAENEMDEEWKRLPIKFNQNNTIDENLNLIYYISSWYIELYYVYGA